MILILHSALSTYIYLHSQRDLCERANAIAPDVDFRLEDAPRARRHPRKNSIPDQTIRRLFSRGELLPKIYEARDFRESAVQSTDEWNRMENSRNCVFSIYASLIPTPFFRASAFYRPARTITRIFFPAISSE